MEYAFVNSDGTELEKSEKDIINRAHDNITRIKGKSYAPSTEEISKEIQSINYKNHEQTH